MEQDLGWQLKMACIEGHFQLATNLIENHNAPIEMDTLGLAAMNGHDKLCSYLLSKGADVHSGNDYALRWACDHGQLKPVKLLVENGAYIEAQDNFSIFWANENKHYEIVDYLLEKKADWNRIKHDSSGYLKYKGILNKSKIKAQKKLYFWWIKICYDHERSVGKRMMVKSWIAFNRICNRSSKEEQKQIFYGAST